MHLKCKTFISAVANMLTSPIFCDWQVAIEKKPAPSDHITSTLTTKRLVLAENHQIQEWSSKKVFYGGKPRDPE